MVAHRKLLPYLSQWLLRYVVRCGPVCYVPSTCKRQNRQPSVPVPRPASHPPELFVEYRPAVRDHLHKLVTRTREKKHREKYAIILVLLLLLLLVLCVGYKTAMWKIIKSICWVMGVDDHRQQACIIIILYVISVWVPRSQWISSIG